MASSEIHWQPLPAIKDEEEFAHEVNTRAPSADSTKSGKCKFPVSTVMYLKDDKFIWT